MGCEGCTSAFDRRSFLRFMAAGAAGLTLNPFGAAWAQGTVKAKSCILLWMGGGPSQIDTFDPKPGRPNGGPFTAIDTSIKGLQLSQNLPRLAEQAKHFSVIRSMTTGEAAHERGAYLMHTGYTPISGLDFAPLGTIASYELGELAQPNFPLPTFLALAPPDVPRSSVFGDEHLPFVISDLNNPIPNLRQLTDASRTKRRRSLIDEQDSAFEEGRPSTELRKLRNAARKAQDLMTTQLIQAFDVNRESPHLRAEYGPGFGTHCLLARRLVQAGVPFIEVGLGGWDTHNDNFNKVKKLSTSVDQGFGTLLKDLAARDMLKETLVVWAGEFGRTPTVNRNKGRDHWARGFSVVMAGGGIEGGRVIGDTGTDGMGLTKPVRVQDLFATIYKCLGIDAKKEYSVSGRSVTYGRNGRVIDDLF